MNGNACHLFFGRFLLLHHDFLTWNCCFNHTGLYQLDTGSEADMEAAIDPLLYHYQGPVGSLLRRDNMYSNDPSEVYTGLSGFTNN